MIRNDSSWSLNNSCKYKFKVGQQVKTRSDIGGYNLVVTKIHNAFYAECRDKLPLGILGKRRHFNMNCLE